MLDYWVGLLEGVLVGMPGSVPVVGTGVGLLVG